MSDYVKLYAPNTVKKLIDEMPCVSEQVRGEGKKCGGIIVPINRLHLGVETYTVIVS